MSMWQHGVVSMGGARAAVLGLLVAVLSPLAFCYTLSSQYAPSSPRHSSKLLAILYAAAVAMLPSVYHQRCHFSRLM